MNEQELKAQREADQRITDKIYEEHASGLDGDPEDQTDDE